VERFDRDGKPVFPVRLVTFGRGPGGIVRGAPAGGAARRAPLRWAPQGNPRPHGPP
jgi:hypothetical protein